MADALDKLRAGADKARTKLAAQRLGSREWDVAIQQFTAGNKYVGTEGTWTTTLTITPRPRVRFRPVFRMTEEGLMRVGDVEVSGIARSYSDTQMRGPDTDMPNRWVIDGRNYSLVGLESRPLEWVATLQSQDA